MGCFLRDRRGWFGAAVAILLTAFAPPANAQPPFVGVLDDATDAVAAVRALKAGVSRPEDEPALLVEWRRVAQEEVQDQQVQPARRVRGRHALQRQHR